MKLIPVTLKFTCSQCTSVQYKSEILSHVSLHVSPPSIFLIWLRTRINGNSVCGWMCLIVCDLHISKTWAVAPQKQIFQGPIVALFQIISLVLLTHKRFFWVCIHSECRLLLSIPPSRIKMSKKTSRPLNIRRIDCPEKSVRNYRCKLCNIQQERRSLYAIFAESSRFGESYEWKQKVV